MAVYQTHQKKALTDFLTGYADTPFTIEELADEMQRADFSGSPPGKSTVYRLMNKLVEDGTVKRFVKGNSRQFLYQIAGGEECHRHLHMKCTKCGKLLHMDDDASEKLLSSVLDSSEFTVDREETTLFGCCRTCKKTSQKK